MIIITGGAGFIGSALIWKLNRDGETDILVVDKFDKLGQWKNLRGLRFSDVILAGDFFADIGGYLKDNNIECIVHLGACSDTTEHNFSYLIQENFETTKSLALFCLEEGIKFVYASSAATYGKGEFGFDDKDKELLFRLRPLNPYAYSKHLFDLWALKNNILDDIVGIKYFNVFGPNEYHKAHMRSMVLKAYEQVKAQGKVRLFKSYHPDYEDGRQKRDFIYVKDAIAMTVFLMQSKDAKGIYNVGTGVANTWIDLILPIFKALKVKPDIEYIDMPDEIKGQYQYETQADMEKLFALGYKKDLYRLEDAVSEYVVDYIEKERFLGDDLIDINS